VAARKLTPLAPGAGAEVVRSRPGEVWPAVLLVALAAVLRLPGLGESLWCDEVNYSTSSGVSSLAGLWSYVVHRPEAPLYRALLLFWNRVAGDHELVVRLPSLISGLVCVGLTWRLARACCGRSVALLAALLLSLSPVHVWYSQEATPYSMTLLLLLAATVVWLRLVKEGGGLGRLAAYAGLILAAVLTHYYAAAFLLPLSVLALWAPRAARRGILAANCLAGAVVVAALGAKMATGHLATGLGYLRPFTPFELWMLLLHWFPTGNTIWRVLPYRATTTFLLEHPLLILCQLAYLALLLIGLRLIWRQVDGPLRWALPLALVTLPAALLTATGLGFRHLYIERYLLLLLPFFLIAVARGATGLTVPWARRLAAFLTIGLSLAALSMLRVRDDVWTVYKQNPDWRAAARVLEAQANGRGEAVAFCSNNCAALAHYLRRIEAEGPRARVYRLTAIESVVSSGDVNTLYLVRNRYWDAGFDQALRHWSSDPRLRSLGTESVKGVDIHAFSVVFEPAPASRRRGDMPTELPGFFGDGFESGGLSAW